MKWHRAFKTTVVTLYYVAHTISGLKNTLFDLYLFSDAACLAVAAVLILACILVFTQVHYY